jgi:hypothetical protein
MAAVFLLVVWRDLPLVLILRQFYIRDILCRFCTDESHGSTNSRTLLFPRVGSLGTENSTTTITKMSETKKIVGLGYVALDPRPRHDFFRGCRPALTTELESIHTYIGILKR